MTTIVKSPTENIPPLCDFPLASLGRFLATVAIATGME